MIALCGIVIVFGVVDIIFLGCIYETLVKQLSRICEFKNMYRREIQDLHAIHDYQDELIRELYKKTTNKDVEKPVNTDSALQDEESEDDDSAINIENVEYSDT